MSYLELLQVEFAYLEIPKLKYLNLIVFVSINESMFMLKHPYHEFSVADYVRKHGGKINKSKKTKH